MPIEEHDIRRMLDAYLTGKASQEEVQILERFFRDHKDAVLKDDLKEEKFAFLEDRLKSNIRKKITPVKKHPAWSWAVAASVSILLIAGLLYLFPSQNATPDAARQPVMLTKSTEKGQKLIIRLPDGSVVKLNANSSVSFPEAFEETKREVTLRGEAFFEVAHNPSLPFVVTTDHGQTTVLGTTFNILERPGRAEITLVTGKVRVDDRNAKSVLLKPNQQARLSARKPGIDTLSVNVEHFIEWKDNVLSFRRRTLEDAVTDLENWYGVDITLDNPQLKSCKITARYENESLENVLESFKFMLKGNYTLRDKKVTISGKGCKWN